MSISTPVTIERIDDVPLLLAQLDRMGLRELLDIHFPTHGNWLGLSLGWVVVLWLTHILSEGDHRLNHVEPWAMSRRETLCRCTGMHVNRLDLADDHLALVLRSLANDDHWDACEGALASRLMRVYELTPTCVRLDTTTASSYRPVTKDGLFQLGQSKDHHPDLPQVKVALATLDPLGLPIATAVVAGQRADDPLYVPAVRKVRRAVGRRGLLYVGDCKMGALATRAFVQQGGDYYLCPLAPQHLPGEELDRYLEPVWEGTQLLTPVYAQEGEPGELLAEGYERFVELTATVAGKQVTWRERRLVLRSPAQAKSEEAALRDRVAQTLLALSKLNERGMGKRRARDGEAFRARVGTARKRYHVEALIAVAVTEQVTERRVKSYQGRPARLVEERDWQVVATVEEEALAAALRRLGWRVFVTNGPEQRLSLEQAVLAYRGQFRIERGFGRLKGRSLSLTPLYLQQEEHVVGLIRLLSLALRVLCLIEFVVRRGLAATGESLAGLYAGQPKRATSQPTSEALLRAFGELHLVRIHGATATLQQITPLNALQERILALLELPPDTYSRLLCNSSHPDSK
jgi:transposase